MRNPPQRKSSPYEILLSEVKERVRAAQYEALRTVNKELISLYWDIGGMIEERQKKGSWGKSIVSNLARDLRSEFPGVHGFSAQNLWYMRQFYLAYHHHPKLQPLVGEISWAKHLIIMSKCKDPQEREFYIRMTRKCGWSKSAVLHHIDNQSYESTLLGQTSFKNALPQKLRTHARLAVKDNYTFDFLELGEDHAERELERGLVERIEQFLHAMGGLFAFVGRQFRIEVAEKEYFIDLLLYHRRLRCLVVIELKIGEFEPEFVGKMQFYLTALDKHVREAGENPSIGIILCKEKNRTIVEYTLKESRKPIGVATYHIVRQLPKKYAGQLPSPEEIAKWLEATGS